MKVVEHVYQVEWRGKTLHWESLVVNFFYIGYGNWHMQGEKGNKWKINYYRPARTWDKNIKEIRENERNSTSVGGKEEETIKGLKW